MWHGALSVLGQSFDSFELIHLFDTCCTDWILRKTPIGIQQMCAEWMNEPQFLNLWNEEVGVAYYKLSFKADIWRFFQVYITVAVRVLCHMLYKQMRQDSTLPVVFHFKQRTLMCTYIKCHEDKFIIYRMGFRIKSFLLKSKRIFQKIL